MTNDGSVRSKTITYIGKIGWVFVSLQILLILTLLIRFKFSDDSTFMWIKTELSVITSNLNCGLIPTFNIMKLISYFLGLNILCPIACFMGWLERKKSENKNAIIIASIMCALITVVLSLILATYYQPCLLFEMGYSGQ